MTQSVLDVVIEAVKTIVAISIFPVMMLVGCEGLLREIDTEQYEKCLTWQEQGHPVTCHKPEHYKER